MRSILVLLGTAMTMPTAPGASSSSATASAPGIVLILADDLGVGQVGAYGNGYYNTPSIDRLAREGMRFTSAYAACPVCSPTRAGLMTGKHPARLHVTDFIPGNPFPHARLRQPEWQAFLPLEEETVAEVLAAHGYVTALFGKWHLARGYFPPESVGEDPDRQGFTETLITHKPDRTADPGADAHSVERITARGLAFLRDHAGSPFFLVLSHNSVHAPIMAPRALVEKYRARPGSDRPENNPVLGAMMEMLDGSVGRVVDKLEELGLRERTLVIFTSDNGGLLGDASQAPLRGGKAQLYEGGIRVPLVMNWPGVIAPGRTVSAPVTTMDLSATLVEVSGSPIRAAEAPDGISLAATLRGGSEPAREGLFWHYPHYHSNGLGPSGAVRTGDWKLIEYFETSLTGDGPPLELFNLREDPGEQRNLAAAEAGRAAELRAKLEAWRKEVGAQMPAINSAYDPRRAARPR